MASGFKRFAFSTAAVEEWEDEDERHGNWPVVYVLDDGNAQANVNRPRDIYVGESLNLANRLRQHLSTPAKQHLRHFRAIIDERYNKSVCLDLESYLIKMLAGDDSNRVLNRNNGITDTKYYNAKCTVTASPLSLSNSRRTASFREPSPKLKTAISSSYRRSRHSPKIRQI
jgi:hypothetical protein